MIVYVGGGGVKEEAEGREGVPVSPSCVLRGGCKGRSKGVEELRGVMSVPI